MKNEFNCFYCTITHTLKYFSHKNLKVTTDVMLLKERMNVCNILFNDVINDSYNFFLCKKYLFFGVQFNINYLNIIYALIGNKLFTKKNWL